MPAHQVSSHESYWKSGVRALGAGLALAALPLQAAPIVLGSGSINMFRDFRATNDVGIASGDRLQYGANVLGGSLGTSLGAFYAPQGLTDAASPCSPLLINANFCSNSIPFANTNPSSPFFGIPRILEPWTFTFTRPGETPLVVTGPSLAGADFKVPQPTSVTISGSGLTPTISWTLPAGYLPDGFRVQIYDKAILSPVTGNPAIVHSDNLATTATSYTLPSVLDEGGPIAFGRNYSINFEVITTRGNVPFTSQPQILTRSQSWFAFTPLDSSAPPAVALPEVGTDPIPGDSRGAPYLFSVGEVGPDSVTFIDPFVAIGYDFAIGAGDPNFASVILPDVGDGLFELLFGSESHIVADGDQFFFPAGGVGEFSVRGIETSAMLDPGNVTAFITGLTFVDPGSFTGTMTPITAFVPDAVVPAPATLALLAVGFLGLGRRLLR